MLGGLSPPGGLRLVSEMLRPRAACARDRAGSGPSEKDGLGISGLSAAVTEEINNAAKTEVTRKVSPGLVAGRRLRAGASSLLTDRARRTHHPLRVLLGHLALMLDEASLPGRFSPSRVTPLYFKTCCRGMYELPFRSLLQTRDRSRLMCGIFF